MRASERERQRECVCVRLRGSVDVYDAKHTCFDCWLVRSTSTMLRYISVTSTVCDCIAGVDHTAR